MRCKLCGRFMIKRKVHICFECQFTKKTCLVEGSKSRFMSSSDKKWQYRYFSLWRHQKTERLKSLVVVSNIGLLK